jgi:hypothetical protein
MALGSLGTFCSVQTKAAGSSWTFSPEAQYNAGEMCVLIVATNNNATGDGNFNEHLSVTDTGGNVWTKAHPNGEFANGQGSAAAGATVSVWRSFIKTTVTVALGSLTLTMSTSQTAKAATGWRFSLGLSGLSVVGSAVLADDGIDPGSMTLSSLANVAHLFVRAIAQEDPSTTWVSTGSYTPFDHAGANTTGGAAATNMAARGEFRILSATGDTSNPSSVAADHASLYLAFDEVDPRPRGVRIQSSREPNPADLIW